MKELIVRELINYFISENNEYKNIEVPDGYEEQRKLLRGLINIREPFPISNEVLVHEDELLQIELKEKGIIDINSLEEIDDNIILWQGDITKLKIDCIVNAANSQGLGCFQPLHNCIDNQIHTFAGIRMRLKCNEYMKNIDYNLPTGEVFITKGYNLPSKYVIHTVGPIIESKVTENDEKELANCYINSLKLAVKQGIKTIAFPCISTGVFRFPKDKACEIAIESVKDFLKENEEIEKVIFNVYTEEDLEIYKSILK